MPLHKFKKRVPEFIKAVRFTKENVDEIGFLLKEVANDGFWSVGSVATNDISAFVVNQGPWSQRITIRQGEWLVLKDGKVSKMTNEDILTNWEVVIPPKSLDND
jgi:hypothetical protein